MRSAQEERPADTGPTGLWIVIAAYNEAASIGGVVAGVRALHPRVVVIDDGSADETAAAARAAGAIVLRHAVNLGQGAGLQTGITFALAQGAEMICTFDADGQHLPMDIAPMAQALAASGADVALGSRFLGRAVGLRTSRRLMLNAAILLTRLMDGLKLSDAHNGFRMFTRAAAGRLNITQNRMAHASQIVSQIAAYRLRWIEHPVTVIYTEYSRAKGQKLFDAVNVLADLVIGRIAR